MEDNMNIKYKSIGLAVGVLFVLTLILNASLIYNEEFDLKDIIAGKHQIIKDVQHGFHGHVNEKVLIHLSAIVGSPYVIELFETRQREKLHDHLKPIYENLQSHLDNAVNVYHFYLKDGTSFLRMHNPEHYGDNTLHERPLLKKAIETKTLATGYEAGKYGVFYRVEYPIVVDSEVVGVIDIGIDFRKFDDHLQNHLHDHDALETVTLIPHEMRAVTRKAFPVFQFEGENALVGSDEAVAKVIEIGSGNLKEGELFSYHGRYFFPYITEIKDQRQKILAKLIYLFDITEEVQHKREQIENHVMISLIALVLLVFILHKSFNEIIGKLVDSETRFKSLFANMQNAVAIYKPTGDGRDFIIQNINQSAEKIEKVDRDVVIGKVFSKVFEAADKRGLRDILKDVNESGIGMQYPCADFEDDHLRSWRDYYVYKLPTGEIVAIYDDKTEKKRVEEKRKILEEDLKQKNMLYKKLVKELDERVKEQTSHMLQQSRLAQMGEMISMIAHQWRQPLASISAISGTLTMDVIMDTYKKDFFQERLESITDLSSHLSSTIDDFRDFFKATKDKENATWREMVQSSLNIIGPTLKTRNIALHTSFEEDEKIETYPNEVRQVILNVIKNAEDVIVDKEIADGEIRLRSFRRGDRVCLSIEDNAGGIPGTIIDRIFDPYFSTKEKKDGTGLGLYMSKTIIEEHCKGSFSVANSDRGALFEIALPLEDGLKEEKPPVYVI